MNLNQVTIPSKDVEKATKFYETLGLQIIVNALPRYVRFECPDGSATFSIHEVETLPKGDGIITYFEEEDLDNYVAMLESKGIVFTLAPTDQPWLWREAHLFDPDGNKIILFKAGEHRKNPPWRVTASS